MCTLCPRLLPTYYVYLLTSVHKEKAVKVEESSGPIGSVYKKTKPQAEIRIKERDQFWEKTQVC